MATLGPAAKMRRVLDDRVLARLAEFGFAAADRTQGWELLRALGMAQSAPVSTAASNAAPDGLDAWRRRWVRVASVSLLQDFPRVHDKIFAGIKDSKQPAFAAVSVFLDRIAKLEQARDASSRDALAKLRRRGLSDARIAEARRLLTDLKAAATRLTPKLDERRAVLQAAEAALWKYYVEWSEVARAVIKDPRLLQRLGFRGGADDEQPAEPIEPPAQPEAPARVSKTKRRARSNVRSRSRAASTRTALPRGSQ